jgi:prepilin peptidase CpaA
LIVACISDIRARRIPNKLVATVLVLGVLVSAASDPVMPGLLKALGGVSVGLVVWLPGWLLRMMGAGDVKLFAAAGAWLGPFGALNAALFAAVSGGVLALIWMVAVRGAAGTHRSLWSVVAAPRTLLNARTDSTNSRELVPYSLAITVGVAVQLARPGLVFG